MSEPLVINRPGPSGENSNPRRRAFVRYPGGPTTRTGEGNNSSCRSRWAEIRDISRLEIDLVLGRAFDPDMWLSIVLPTTALDNLHELAARVVRSHQRADGRWVVGCEFLTPLNDAQLLALQ
jgi:hypothetical protein